MDSFVPTIPEPATDAIEAKFPHKTLTKVEGQPTYVDFFLLCEELYRNALSSKSPFGGGNHGHIDACMDKVTYTITTGGDKWTIPATAGMFPAFPAGANDDQKNNNSSPSLYVMKPASKLQTPPSISCATNSSKQSTRTTT